MTGVALADGGPLLSSLAGTRIPRRAWGDVNDLTAVLRESRDILSNAQRQAQAVWQQAHEAGFKIGMLQAQTQCAGQLLEAQRAALEFLGTSQERIVALALAIVERIAPRLNEAELVTALAAEVLTTIRTERHLRVSVTEEAKEATGAMLEQWRQAHPEIESVQVVVDRDLEPFGCIVESELGRIQAGLRTQLAAIGEGLTAVAARARS